MDSNVFDSQSEIPTSVTTNVKSEQPNVRKHRLDVTYQSQLTRFPRPRVELLYIKAQMIMQSNLWFKATMTPLFQDQPG